MVGRDVHLAARAAHRSHASAKQPRAARAFGPDFRKYPGVEGGSRVRRCKVGNPTAPLAAFSPDGAARATGDSEVYRAVSGVARRDVDLYGQAIRKGRRDGRAALTASAHAARVSFAGNVLVVR